MVRRTHHALLLAMLLGLAALPPAHVGDAGAMNRAPGLPQPGGLTVAMAAERNGDYAAAEAGYRALAASQDLSASTAAGLALGRLLVERLNRYADALPVLQTVQAALGHTTDGLRATFLIAEAQAGLRQNQAAAAAFRSYLAAGGAASGYAALQLATVLAADRKDDAALAALSAPLQAQSLVVRMAALRAASSVLERLGNPAQAATDQQALAGIETGSASGVALLEAARLDRLAGDDARAADTLQQIIRRFPNSAAAGTALDRLDALAVNVNVSVDPLQRAVIQFSTGRTVEARAAFRALLDAEPDGSVAAELNYYLGRIADQKDEDDRALGDYADAYTLDPTGPFAADAAWRRAQLLRSMGRYAEASGAYTAVMQQFPANENASEAAFAAGFMTYLDGRFADAAVAWNPIAATTEPGAAARASLWLGKLAQNRGDAGSGALALTHAQSLQPAGYHGLRAEVAASSAVVSISGPQVSQSATDWGAVEDWLRTRFGPEDAASLAALQSTQDWREGIELDALGWTVTPNTLLHAALTAVMQQPWTLYRAARVFADRELTNLAEAAAAQLLELAGVQTDRGIDAPAGLLRLAYPLGYLDLVNQNAAQYAIDPLLLEAVIRQESAFYPAAGSSAGAQGLLQLEPATARGEATALGLPDASTDDLKRPLVNLQLGAAFLADQAQAHHRDLSETLAAYNAGGSNASRWAAQAGGDPDRFYEAVDFNETRLYIRVISENYAIYNALYRGSAHPTLLRP